MSKNRRYLRLAFVNLLVTSTTTFVAGAFAGAVFGVATVGAWVHAVFGLPSTISDGETVGAATGFAVATGLTVRTYRIYRLGTLTSAYALAEPPKWAEFLVMVLSPANRGDALVGDLNEQYVDDCRAFGEARAKRRYWARTVRTIGPLLLRAAGKIVKWGAVVAVVRRFF
jgi:hypothetical protein